MQVQFSLVGTTHRETSLILDLPVIPRVGETVAWPGYDETTVVVRTVVWYLDGDADGNCVVYIVVGSPRPT